MATVLNVSPHWDAVRAASNRRNEPERSEANDERSLTAGLWVEVPVMPPRRGGTPLSAEGGQYRCAGAVPASQRGDHKRRHDQGRPDGEHGLGHR